MSAPPPGIGLNSRFHVNIFGASFFNIISRIFIAHEMVIQRRDGDLMSIINYYLTERAAKINHYWSAAH